MEKESCDIGLIGLAVMGQNLALNMNDHGYRVAVFNRTVSKVDDFIRNEAAGTESTAATRTTRTRTAGPGVSRRRGSCSSGPGSREARKVRASAPRSCRAGTRPPGPT